jgi:hypothetical protein
MYVTVSTKDFFKNGTGWCRRHDPRPKKQASSFKHQASSVKRQASSAKLFKHQATSVKPQAASVKLQATSGKLPDPGTTVHGY